MPRARRLDIVLAAAGALVIAVLAFLRSAAGEAQTSEPSTYDRGANGLGALYELLQREHVNVRRFESPVQMLSGRGNALIVAGNEPLLQLVLERQARKSIDDWVKAGNTLVLLGEHPPFEQDFFGTGKLSAASEAHVRTACGVRGKAYAVAGSFTQSAAARGCTASRAALLASGGRTYGSAYRHGKGEVVFIFSVTPFDNAHLASAGNAQFAYAVFSAIGPAAFDERAYGYTGDKRAWTVLPGPVRYAIALCAAMLLLALIGANLPSAPPLIPRSGGVRGTGEYLASLAAMLHRAGARREMVERYCSRIKKALAPHQAQAQARALLEQARSLELQFSANDDDLLAAARLHARVRKDYPW